MRRKRSDGIDTRQRLLAAAGEIFACQGFWEASLADICRAAHANIAAANYHFHSKEELYVAAWRAAHDRLLALHPPDGGVPASAPAEQRLRGRIQALLNRMFDPRGHDLAMIHMEMAFPTGLLTAPLQETVQPLRAAFLRLVRELAGPSASAEQIRLCLVSILTQCFGMRLHGRSEPIDPRHPPPPPSRAAVVKMAAHVTSFSLAGIRSLTAAPATPASPAGRSARRRPLSHQGARRA